SATSRRRRCAPSQARTWAPSLVRWCDLRGRTPSTGWSDVDFVGVVGRCSAWGGAAVGQYVGAPPRVRAGRVPGEPRALLAPSGAGGDAVGYACGQHHGSAVVEDAHELAVADAAGAGVRGVQPHIVAVNAAEHGLVAVDGVGPGTRLRREQFERIAAVLP